MKNRDAILRNRWLRPFAHLFGHPSLWHMNRRSVPRGLAVGLFAGFALPLGQFVLAAFAAVPLRANVPLAAAATLVTNPITFPPIYLAAYRFGRFILHHWSGRESDQLTSLGARILDVSAPTAVGLLTFAIGASVAGFLTGVVWWRVRIGNRWKSRHSGLRPNTVIASKRGIADVRNPAEDK